MSEGDMELDKAAVCLSKLGNPARLAMFRLLVKAGDEGLAVGDIQKELDMPHSTLSHHISHMMTSGLLIQSREGRVLRCRLDYQLTNSLLEYLMEDCCKGLQEA
ncbi:ArsR/SmtB family transcription factor [Kiloniella majae]|nr:helix-turn-helix domain-containing protein [Kiloniella majae]